MAIVTVDVVCPVHPNYPMPSLAYTSTDYNFHIRQFSSDTISATGIVYYFPGSGAVAHPLTTNPFIIDLTDRGYIVVSFGRFGMEGASSSPYKTSYGNVNDPHFTAHWIKSGWDVASALAFLAGGGSLPFVLLGSSQGASSILAHLAGYCGTDAPAATTYANFRGALSCAPTVGGLGGYQWNDLPRNINSMCNMVYLNNAKTLIAGGGLDDYAPPDYVRRTQQVIPDGKDTYELTPGPTFPHSFVGTTLGAPIVGRWVSQLMNNTTITLADGTTPAIIGGVVP